MAAVLTVATLIALVACGEHAPKGIAVGYPFPVIALPGLTGKPALSAEARLFPSGKAAVINFWATWCEPCRREMPSLERLHRLADPAKLVVIGVTVDTDLNLAREFLLQYQLAFPNYSDSAQKLARDVLRVSAFPATFLVAADGTVRAQITGPRDWDNPEALRWLEGMLGNFVASK